VLRLQGHGMTGLAGALRRAQRELAGSRAHRRVVVLLSDCRATDEVDPLPAARAIPELVILAPAADDDEARAFAARAGARVGTVEHLLAMPQVLEDVLSG
jgi:Mg-chelatase subunit ChlD